jgi:putative heme-binding domain-containing protein
LAKAVNIDYILTNILDPSAVVGRDYQMTTVITNGGRVVSGLIKEENESAVVLQTVNEVVVVDKSDIDERALTTTSMMPDGQLQQMKPEEARDLIAYLASPSQVPLPGAGPVYDEKTKRVAGALEGESLKILSKTAGNTSVQGMGNFGADRWSDAQVWWTGAKPGGRLVLEVPVKSEGRYEIFAVMTKARDYGIVQLSIDDTPLGTPIDSRVEHGQPQLRRADYGSESERREGLHVRPRLPVPRPEVGRASGSCRR